MFRLQSWLPGITIVGAILHKDKKSVVIIANGEALKQKLKNFISDEDIIIAADGGVINCKITNIIPDFIVGDLDSIQLDINKYFPTAEIILNSDQETTDMQKALNLAISLHPKKIKVFSASGKRTDHTVGNILIFHKMIKLILEESIELEIFDNFGKMKIQQLDTLIEEWFVSKFKTEIDFEVTDALGKLERLGTMRGYVVEKEGKKILVLAPKLRPDLVRRREERFF